MEPSKDLNSKEETPTQASTSVSTKVIPKVTVLPYMGPNKKELESKKFSSPSKYKHGTIQPFIHKERDDYEL